MSEQATMKTPDQLTPEQCVMALETFAKMLGCPSMDGVLDGAVQLLRQRDDPRSSGLIFFAKDLEAARNRWLHLRSVPLVPAPV